MRFFCFKVFYCAGTTSNSTNNSNTMHCFYGIVLMSAKSIESRVCILHLVKVILPRQIPVRFCVPGMDSTDLTHHGYPGIIGLRKGLAHTKLIIWRFKFEGVNLLNFKNPLVNIKKTDGSNYSRMDQAKFVEDSL